MSSTGQPFSKTCADFGSRHAWTQIRPGLWPFKSQPCLCGSKTWT